jgi:hypothetical protein
VLVNQLSLVVGMLLLSQAPTSEGKIGGRVVNSTRGESPVGAADVMLRVRIDGEFVAVARATADRDGRFLFEGLPVDQGLVYLPGANQDGIHYPGPRIRLSSEQPNAQVVLKVQETIVEPNPLVIRDYDLILQPEPGALRVSETLIIENPGPTTYVGRKPQHDAEPVTLQLAIPPEFERVTFQEEFYGRQFSLLNGKLVTGIPWTPGRREVRFSYVLRNDGRQRVWTRPLDLPCRHVRVTVHTDHPDEMSCNLGAWSHGHDGTAIFETNHRELPAGYTIRVELSRLPVSVMVYARWVVLAVLALAIAGSCLVMRRHRRSNDRSEVTGIPHPHTKNPRARSDAKKGNPRSSPRT